MFGCSVDGVGLLFLPAAASLWTISTTINYSDGALGSIRGRISDPLLADARQKPCNRFGIRLASRSELFGCSVVGLLFLPAEYPVCYWSVSSRADAREYICEAVRIQGEYSAWAYGIWRYARCMLRLASRSELFGCSFDGFGLLFLPAADDVHIYYWSFLALSANPAGPRAWYVNGGNGWFVSASSRDRIGKLAIRLASRSELFGCSFDGVGVSVPARCG